MIQSRRKYNEPIFYFNPVGNCFLVAEYITQNSIVLHTDSQIPDTSGKIDFSFPNSDHVVSCSYRLVLEGGKYLLQFARLKTVDKLYIDQFIRKDEIVLPLCEGPEVTF